MNTIEWTKGKLTERLKAVCTVIVMLEEAQAKYPPKSHAHLGFEPLLLARREENDWLVMMLLGIG